MTWERLTTLKKEGGMGFRDLKAFDRAMIAKQGWKLVSKPNSLVAKVFKASGIKVMQEPWLQDKELRWVNGPQTQEVYDLRVKDPLLPNSKQWDISKVRSTLDHLGAGLILKVSLMEDVVQVMLIWQEETNGEYSVKSGYRVWRKMQSSSGKNGVEGNWNALWNIIAPPRAKQLLWRICRGCLPTRSNLQKHHVQCSSLCPCREDNRDAGRFAVMLYNLWRSRNKVVWQDTREDASSIGVQAFHNWQDWFLAKEDNNSVTGTTIMDSWILPLYGQGKCNVDAGFNNICGTTNRGWCFRDHLGRFQTAGVAWNVGFLSVMEAEAMAFKEAIQKAIFLQLSHVVFESDCQSVVHAVYSK
ncbi:uncharacterized protein LOC131659838 [Vicia villosa]|uniref:uncharacterized protein LOC131659838 n=1 Tax=Vicia villosa TaxID=3911 RepID=UPI00273AA58F|nr:uncharacterized protein LOC131659838 [Vicia villosa]